MKKVAFIILLPFLSACSTVVDLATKTAEVWMEPSVPVGEPEDRLSMIALSMNATPQVNPNIYSDNIPAGEAEEEAPVEKLQADPQETLEKPIGVIQPGEIKDENALICDELARELADEIEVEEPTRALAGAIETGEPVAVQTDSEEAEATPISFKIVQLKDNSLFLQADFEGVFADIEKALGTTYLAHDDFMLIPGEFKFVEPFEVKEETRYVAVVAAYNDYVNKQWKGIVKIQTKGKAYSLLLHFDEQKVVIKKQEL